VEKARAILRVMLTKRFEIRNTRLRHRRHRFMLESKDLGGKCADLNALYVGLARAAGFQRRRRLWHPRCQV